MSLGLKRFFNIVVVRAFGAYVLFLFISGAIFAGVLSLVIGTSLLTPAIVLNFSSAFVVAWLAGLITRALQQLLGGRELIIVVLLTYIAHKKIQNLLNYHPPQLKVILDK